MRSKSTIRLATLTIALLPLVGSAATEDGGEKKLEEIFRVVFPLEIKTSGETKALSCAAAGYRFKNLDEVNDFNATAPDVVSNARRSVTRLEPPLESPWWWLISEEEGCDPFIDNLGVALGRRRIRPAALSFEFPSVLAKALAQRDFYQTFELLKMATSRTVDAARKRRGEEMMAAFSDVWPKLLLSEKEYQGLRDLLPTSLSSEFQGATSYSLEEAYLPLRAIQQDPTWYEIAFIQEAARHFKSYRGRSFIRVYISAPGYAPQRLRRMWESVYIRFGKSLHAAVVREPPPLGMRTMLVRTFGVFLENGLYADSGFPEEVLLRVFKKERPVVDLESSDFRGTLCFQYKMGRERLLSNPASMGLKRIRDDDLQFFGFFGDVPDPVNSYSDTVTSMRANCIGCHSELHFGLGTIFSFESNPFAHQEGELSQDGMLKGAGHGYFTPLFDSYDALHRTRGNEMTEKK